MSVYLYEIQIFNFKSFDNLWKIGPCKPHTFNAIIGPNGVGKSNIIDAIAFCVGEKSINLRVTKMADLVINSEDDETRDTFVTVKFQYVNNDDEITFKRSIIRNSSEFQINGQIVTRKEYDDKLQDLYINITAKHFIIYQDDISSISTMNPKERTIFFEQMSRSINFKEEYNYWKNKLDELNLKAKNCRDENRKHRAHRKKLMCAQIEKNKLFQLKIDYEKTLTELSLFDLYVIELRCKQFKKDLTEMGGELEKVNRNIQECEDNLQIKRTKIAGLIDTDTAINDRINNIRTMLNEISSDCHIVDEKLFIREQRLVKSEKVLASMIKDEESRDHVIAQLEKDLEEVMEAKTQFSTNCSQQFQEFIEIKPEWNRKYDALKAIVAKEAAQFYQKLNKLERKKQPALNKVQDNMRKRDEIKSHIQRKEDYKVDMAKQIQTMQNNIQETEEKLRIQKKVHAELTENINSSETRREKLENDLQIITDRLNDCKISQTQHKKILHERDIMKKLRDSFPGVHGYVYRLFQPQHERYKIAFTKIFAPYFSNIVVDTPATALKCIKYLKDYKIGRFTFLPLDDNLNVTKLKEQLRLFEKHEGIKNVKLLYDVVKFLPEMERVVLHITGNTLVCETSEVAMNVAYNMPSGIKYNCVALDGTYYKKSGLFSGGTVTIEEKSKVLSATVQEEMETKRDEIRMVLKKICNNMDKSDLKIIEVEITQLQRKLGHYNKYLWETEEKNKCLIVEIDELKNDLQKVEEIISEAQVRLDLQDKKIESIQMKISDVESEIFADFCDEVNVSNIKKYEEPLKDYKQMKLKILEYDEQYERIQNILKYEKKRNRKQEIKKITADIDNARRQIEELRVSGMDEKKKLNKYTEHLNKNQQTLAMTNCEIERIQQEIAKEEKFLKELSDYRATLNETSFAMKIMENFRNRHDLILDTLMHGVTLPLLDGTSLNLATDLYSISEESASSQELVTIYEREDELKFDYTYLQTKPKSIKNEIEICEIREQYKEKLDELESTISSFDLTIKVSQELEMIKNKMKTIDGCLAVTLKVIKESQLNFEKVKDKRYTAFMDYFEPTAENIDEIYKGMNCHISAQALLYAENPEEPYLGNIYFDCIPPGKRYGPGNLSGGETALAALSLIFAIQRHNPSPFLLLDEFDAAFDDNNRKNVMKYIGNMKNRQQIIAISQHKELFHYSNTIIGVYPIKTGSSHIESNLIVLDLSVYS